MKLSMKDLFIVIAAGLLLMKVACIVLALEISPFPNTRKAILTTFHRRFPPMGELGFICRFVTERKEKERGFLSYEMMMMKVKQCGVVWVSLFIVFNAWGGCMEIHVSKNHFPNFKSKFFIK